MSDRHLTLVIPGLLVTDTPDGAGEHAASYPRLAAFECLLSRAVVKPAANQSIEHLLLSLFGLEQRETDELPVASITRCYDAGEINSGWWMRADPVHVQPGLDSVLMFGNHLVDINAQEATLLVDELNRHFATEGWTIEVHHTHRWYLHHPHAPVLKTWPLQQVIGRNIHSFLPTGDDATSWHGLLNEVQMVLHTSSVNQAREERGEPMINSLWFWGSGTIPTVPPQKWQGVWSNDPLIQGLAIAGGMEPRPLPASAIEWNKSSQHEGDCLVVIDEAALAHTCGNTQDWQHCLQRLEAEWGEPLLTALKAGELSSLSLYPGNGFVYHTDASLMRRWWKRVRPVQHFLKPRVELGR